MYHKYVFHILLAKKITTMITNSSSKEFQKFSSVPPSIANLTFVNLHGSNLCTRLLKLGLSVKIKKKSKEIQFLKSLKKLPC